MGDKRGFRIKKSCSAMALHLNLDQILFNDHLIAADILFGRGPEHFPGLYVEIRAVPGACYEFAVEIAFA